MKKQVREESPLSLGIIFVFVIVLVNNIDVTNASENVIPDKKDGLDTWFESIITPFSDRKTSLEGDLQESEVAPEVITVRIDGSGKFKTITEALGSVPLENKKRVIIDIGPGEYKEKIKVERFKPYITFLGDPKDKPVITYDGNAAKYGTVDSATLIVEADDFVASNIVVQNTSPRPNGKSSNEQALAMRISGDTATFYNCRFLGFQDTVCDDKGRHFFKDCYIEGTVDFIFGEGRSIYLNCELHIIEGDPMAIIAAHARKNTDGETGYSFVHCKVTGSGGMGLLGRAWMDAARTVYSYCHFSDVVKAEGWNDHNNPAAQKTVYFAEYKNEGPGADTAGRVKFAKVLSDDEAKPFLTMEYIEATKWLLPPPKASQ